MARRNLKQERKRTLAKAARRGIRLGGSHKRSLQPVFKHYTTPEGIEVIDTSDGSRVTAKQKKEQGV